MHTDKTKGRYVKWKRYLKNVNLHTKEKMQHKYQSENVT